ncbi:hypothetical protein EVG20_g5111 [Dentipellis fragilis]|uniref:Uncharacterized protein n=1 Tax=Dentipellis fragilis TaxID=205917 RepID=A0A4Y9YW66_9AGAM|nr:hypothetical protein EVG20_g5111 [Dentipellis fragilis]
MLHPPKSPPNISVETPQAPARRDQVELTSDCVACGGQRVTLLTAPGATAESERARTSHRAMEEEGRLRSAVEDARSSAIDTRMTGGIPPGEDGRELGGYEDVWC